MAIAADSNPGYGLEGSQRVQQDGRSSLHLTRIQFSFNPCVKRSQYISYPILARSLRGGESFLT